MNTNDLNQILDALAARFGTTAAHLWNVLLRQVYIDAASSLLQWVAMGVAWTWTVQRFRRVLHDDPEWYRDGTVGFCVLTIMVTLLFLIITGLTVDNVAQCFNPEYGALKLILSGVHSK